MKTRIISKSAAETAAIAHNLALRIARGASGAGAPSAAGAAVIALQGELGAGKTTFTKAFAAALGIPAETVTSPTFVIEKRFDIAPADSHFKRLVHIDAYRLDTSREIEKLGWRETIADPTNIVVIEWPENIGDALPPQAIRIAFTSTDENTRQIDISF
ncbi:MAG: tRNA (adenosine(37)-N6)-threonylcarbamoyltransferase complex ATPase subunit type 1 TsaE [Patescibacteria group bacterium]|nr:tRNA (adenosine(37)-N6)-threonylcarbamoyltransferase complex ATPase subunit type 1 TsaE [Patescibacteria group bacterium]MDE2116870.1 tRNA (adenosine(37)-N6)-threonylcarbamoyltransferase complex ATPase subunit type 1 TsaE [Patescibacteria group bacterium]